MIETRLTRTFLLLVVTGISGLFLSLPAQADMLGGPPPCVAGSSPALFDTDGTPGPSAGDLPAYFEIVTPDPLQILARNPTESCNTPGSNQVSFEDRSGNLWPGTYNRLEYKDWVVDTDAQAPDGGYAIGATLTHYSYTIKYFTLLLLENAGGGSYGRLSAVGELTAEGDLLGWDTDTDGTDDYVGFSWAGLTAGWNPCEVDDGVVISDATMLWVPVVPFARGSTQVKVAVDMNCDGVADGGFPPVPPLSAQTVPVGLQSFTIASLIPAGQGGFGLTALAAAVLIGLPVLLRGRLGGDRSKRG